MSKTLADTPINTPSGETLSVLLRLIVAPASGTFRDHDGPGPLAPGHAVDKGDAIGAIQSLGASTPVQSPFAGVLVSFQVSDGERVRQGQLLAWLSHIPSAPPT